MAKKGGRGALGVPLSITNYTAVDVETANYDCASICSIGLVNMSYGEVVWEKEILVNPQAHFELMNVSIHGITPMMVERAPAFDEVWEEIAPVFEQGIVMAHFAAFDLKAITGALLRYGIKPPEIRYVCTCQKARRHIEKERFGNHRLNTLCKGLNVPLDNHHNALCDAKACAFLYETLVDKFGAYEDDIKTY
ncbi:3'-5' exonuclease [Eubacteriales bacterium OttesenSCG-928-K08]|nr:3'-5' exonuclease [Eubacteriales bacterium OttesenSCG-928-K08]